MNYHLKEIVESRGLHAELMEYTELKEIINLMGIPLIKNQWNGKLLLPEKAGLIKPTQNYINTRDHNFRSHGLRSSASSQDAFNGFISPNSKLIWIRLSFLFVPDAKRLFPSIISTPPINYFHQFRTFH